MKYIIKCVIVLFSLFLIAMAVTEGAVKIRDEYEDHLNKGQSPLGPEPPNQEEPEKEYNNQQEEEEYNPLEEEAEQDYSPQEAEETEDLQETPKEEEEETQSQEDKVDNIMQLMSSCDRANKVKQKLLKALKRFIKSLSNILNCQSSCAAIKRKYPNSGSGYYCIKVGNQPVTMYCNMGNLCGIGGGWTRLAKLDMTKHSEHCPAPFTYARQGQTRLCRKNRKGCESLTLPSYGIRYRQVCGRVRGYRWGGTDAFYRSVNNINKAYLDGVSITRGSPRKHIWSFASGLTEVYTTRYNCPCNRGANIWSHPPSFVGNDYYCEAGSSLFTQHRYRTEDPLWDGKLCRHRESPCCRRPHLPWFLKNIEYTTTDGLELRLCTDPHEGLHDERVGIDQFEFYVK